MENCIPQNATGNAQHDINVFRKEQLHQFKVHAHNLPSQILGFVFFLFNSIVEMF